MAKPISIQLNSESVKKAISQLTAYQASIERKTKELCRQLAEIGATKVSLGYARAAYTGKKDISVSVEDIPGGFAIVAEGETVLFVEFGAGVRYGYGHPQADEFGMGPGTWPDPKYRKGADGEPIANWENPSGWWIPGGEHTYGNPPSATMYQTGKELKAMVLQIAKGVFGNP